MALGHHDVTNNSVREIRVGGNWLVSRKIYDDNHSSVFHKP